MTPDLLEQGAQRLNKTQRSSSDMTQSGGHDAGYARIATAGEVDITHGRILYLEDVNVSFDGFKAINNLSLDIAPGELRCIIGPNGAGKTTMMDIITGKTRPDSGTAALQRIANCTNGHWPQVSKTHRVRATHGV
jgi:urea transport system ATP-binding protein